jgi:hypothetical protein
MFFVKIAFWALLVIILLPSNTQEKLEFYGTAQRSVSDVSHFCDRNAELCESTSAFFTGIYQKLTTTTEMIEEVLRDVGIGGNVENLQNDDTLWPNGRPRPQREGKADNLGRMAATSSMSQDTLTRADLRPSWQGPRRSAAYERRYR